MVCADDVGTRGFLLFPKISSDKTADHVIFADRADRDQPTKFLADTISGQRLASMVTFWGFDSGKSFGTNLKS